MPIAFGCDCGKQFSVADTFAGKRTKCPACGVALTVPEAEQVDLAYTTEAESEDDEAYRMLAEAPDSEVSSAPTAFARRDPDPGSHAPAPPRQASGVAVPAAAETKRKRPKRRNSDDSEYRPRIHITSGILGGFGSMLLAVIWFLVGLSANRIYFYPPILFVFGLVAVIRGFLGYSED